MTNITGGNICSLACIIGAIAVMYSGNDGWGWLLFIAVLFSA
jgi:hypothetical protein